MAPQGGFPLRCPTAKFLQRSIRETIVAREPHEAVIWGLQEMPPTLGVRESGTGWAARRRKCSEERKSIKNQLNGAFTLLET